MKRSRMFSKPSNEIRACVKDGGNNPDFNYRLKSAIQKARDVNMPTANIEKALLAKWHLCSLVTACRVRGNPLRSGRRPFGKCGFEHHHADQFYLGVGKTGIPPLWGSGNRWFKSHRPDHIFLTFFGLLV